MANHLTIGTLLESESGAPAQLLASKMNRHTFWCAQSGSGKTYALGVALEQLLLNTKLPLVILDPNSDFVKLGDIRADAPESREAARTGHPRHPRTPVERRRRAPGAGAVPLPFRCGPGRPSCTSTRFSIPRTTTRCCAWRPTSACSPITTWSGSSAPTPIASAINSRDEAREPRRRGLEAVGLGRAQHHG